MERYRQAPIPCAPLLYCILYDGYAILLLKFKEFFTIKSADVGLL